MVFLKWAGGGFSAGGGFFMHNTPRHPFKNTIVGRPILIFFSLFLKFPIFDGGVPGGGARRDENSTFSVKKVGVPLTRRSK